MLVRCPLMPFMVPRSKLVNHVAAVSLYVAHYNLCRAREALKTTPAVAILLSIILSRPTIFFLGQRKGPSQPYDLRPS